MLEKKWTTTADFEDGTLTNLWVPSGLNRLELKRLNLSGTGVWIFDGGARKKFNWQSFEHTNPNQNIYYRDDFRDNSLEAWTIVGGTWQGVSQYLRGTGNTHWGTNRIRVGPTTWQGLDILLKAYYSDSADPAHRFFLRADHQGSNVNSYGFLVGWDYAGGSGQQNNIVTRWKVWDGNVDPHVYMGSPAAPRGAWYWFRIQIYTSGGNVIQRIKWWLPGASEPGWMWSYTWGGIWRGSGCFCLGRYKWDSGGYDYYDDILISRMEGIPSPPNCSVSFRFAASDDGSSWSSWQTDITKVPNGRYIKIEATLSRNSLLSAMPTLEDMTLTYKLLV